MTREKITKELEKVQSQISQLQKREKELIMEKDAADMAASIDIVEKKKISPELLKAICSLSEKEISEILERRKKLNEENTVKSN